MTIYGREVKLLFTIGARFKVVEMNQKIKDPNMRNVKAEVILSEAYESAAKFADPEHTGKPLTEDEVLSLTSDQYGELCEELAQALTEGNETTVEAEKSKKKEDAELK